MEREVPTSDAAALRSATANAAQMWTMLAHARADEVTSRPEFLMVRGSARFGLRILMLSGSPGAAALAEIRRLTKDFDGPIVVEDPYGSGDFRHLGLASRQMPVMIRRPRAEPAVTESGVTCVAGDDDLLVAESIIVNGFTLDRFLPYEPGRAFPAGLLRRDGVGFFVIARDGEPAGACLTVADDSGTGVYWVTTMPDQRSRGLGRRLMSAVLKQFEDVPITLTASKAGWPLYDSLGFDIVGRATWWS